MSLTPQCPLGGFPKANVVSNARYNQVQLLQSELKTSQNRAIFHIRDNNPRLVVGNHLQQQGIQTRKQPYTQESPTDTARVRMFALPIIDSGLTNSCSEIGVWLPELLEDLAECPSIAQEDDIAEPTDLALAKAKILLEQLASFVVTQPDVYPMQYSSIAIDFRGPSKFSGALFSIDHDGSGVLFHRTYKSKGRLRVNDAVDLLKEGGIWELKRVGVR